MSDLPSYPQDAAEREAAQAPPEAAASYSGWWRRVGAYLLDSLIMFVPLIVLIVIVVAADPGEDSAAWIVVLVAYLATFVIPFIYFTLFHGGSRGQTPGKRALGIRVAADQDGRRLGYGRAFGRYAITFVFGLFVLPLLLDYLWPLWDTKNQALHDKVVSSVVVRA